MEEPILVTLKIRFEEIQAALLDFITPQPLLILSNMTKTPFSLAIFNHILLVIYKMIYTKFKLIPPETIFFRSGPCAKL